MKTTGLILTAFVLFIAMSTAAQAQNFCSQTAQTLFNACKAGVTDDFLVRNAVCLNISDSAERDECFSDSEDSRNEDNQLCRDQKDWRLQSWFVNRHGTERNL